MDEWGIFISKYKYLGKSPLTCYRFKSNSWQFKHIQICLIILLLGGGWVKISLRAARFNIFKFTIFVPIQISNDYVWRYSHKKGLRWKFTTVSFISWLEIPIWFTLCRSTRRWRWASWAGSLSLRTTSLSMSRSSWKAHTLLFLTGKLEVYAVSMDLSFFFSISLTILSYLYHFILFSRWPKRVDFGVRFKIHKGKWQESGCIILVKTEAYMNMIGFRVGSFQERSSSLNLFLSSLSPSVWSKFCTSLMVSYFACVLKKVLFLHKIHLALSLHLFFF